MEPYPTHRAFQGVFPDWDGKTRLSKDARRVLEELKQNASIKGVTYRVKRVVCRHELLDVRMDVLVVEYEQYIPMMTIGYRGGTEALESRQALRDDFVNGQLAQMGAEAAARLKKNRYGL